MNIGSISVTVSDIIQILFLYLVMYAILMGARGSRFGQVLMGVGFLALVLGLFSYVLNFTVLSTIIKFLLAYFAFSSVVIFQPEIRRILATLGAFGYFDRPKHRANGAATPELVTETILDLASRRLGGLFAFERGISLRSYSETGVMVDAIITRELIQTILMPPLPLHDGGVIIRDGRLSAAHCIFPVSNNPNLTAHGMRHRAAVGLSEETDALLVVVSEETGQISFAHNGRLVKCPAENVYNVLLRWVSTAMSGKPQRRTRLGQFLQWLAPKFNKQGGK